MSHPRREPPSGPPSRPTAGIRLLACVAGWVSLVLLAGCVARPPPPAAPVFYPPPPARPRIQFLRSLGSSADVQKPSGWFERFVLGGDTHRQITRLVRPYGVAFGGGRLYVCDSGARVGAVFDFATQEFRLFGIEGAYRLGLPVNVSIGLGGEKYVTDTRRGQVVVYNAEDRPVRAITREGGMRPCDALVHEGELFVADLKANTVLVLDPRSGKVLREFGGGGSKPGQFVQPTNLAFGPQGHLYVSDTLNARVQKLDRDGRVVKVIGTLGRRLGDMVRPKGIAVDREGRLYVADAATESVQLYGPEGRLLMVLGGPGVGRGEMALPAKVAVSYDGIEHFARDAAPGFTIEYLVFVTNQLGPNKVNVYGFGCYEGAVPGDAERIIVPGRPEGGTKPDGGKRGRE